MKPTDDRVAVAIDVLKEIALDFEGILAERQRAIDALTLFREKALPALEYLAKKIQDSNVLKERANLYVRNIKSGSKVNYA